MPGPWEKYKKSDVGGQPAETGPWAKYGSSSQAEPAQSTAAPQPSPVERVIRPIRRAIEISGKEAQAGLSSMGQAIFRSPLDPELHRDINDPFSIKQRTTDLGLGALQFLTAPVRGAARGLLGEPATENLMAAGLPETPSKLIGETLSLGAETVLPMGLAAGTEKVVRGVQRGKQILSRALPIREQAIQREAAARLKGAIKGTEITQPQIDLNVKAAKELEGRIPGLKFTQGQLTDDASAISLERALARKGGQDIAQHQREFANKTLREYYAAKVARSGTPEDLAKYAEKLSGEMQAATKTAENAVNGEVMRLSRAMDEQTTGRTVWERLSAGKKSMKAKATEKYSRIPNVDVQTGELYKSINAIKKDFDPLVESPKNYPGRLIRGVEAKITGKSPEGEIILKDMGFQDLRKLRSQVLSEIRTAQGSATPNDQYIRRLRELQGGIEDSINSLEKGTGKASELYRDASSFYREYVGKYKQGTVADVLSKGRRGEDTRIALANIAKEFDSLDGIDDFIRATGSDSIARDAMRDYYSLDLLNRAKDPATGAVVTKKAMQWLAQNAGKLKKLGIYDEYKNIANMQRQVDKLRQYQDVFNKSVAGRLLESDTETMIANAFRGSKNYASTANELMNMVKGNKAAEEGLKKAFAENLMKQSENTGIEFFQTGGETVAETEFIKSTAKFTNIIKKYSSAIRVIYRNEPEKIKALNDVWKAYQTLGRTAKSPMAGGSDTFENFMSTLIGGAAAKVRPGEYYLIKSVRDVVMKYSSNKIDAYLRRAMFDPEYAETLISMSQGLTPMKIKNFDRQMALIGTGGAILTKEATTGGLREREKK